MFSGRGNPPRRFAAPPFDKGDLAGGGYLGGFFFALRAAF